ncbi:hypothetical protein [Bifidobacterium sp. SO4]|uniref:hypothetical protein n=1 Tax=Bifidobacterium sp. SO4 TaxID=2809030 RepID=UPI001BDCD6C4|nr:hypothetical protein [Bifidobacterium sp. SO4]MBT1170686.1 hypothetical protein [Bifidobacterium sp. SO4]
MNGIVSPPLFSRILCGEHGVGSVEWHGMHMLVITYGQDTEADGPDEARVSSTADDEAERAVSGGRRPEPLENVADVRSPAPPTDQVSSATVLSEPFSTADSAQLTRDDVLDSLRRLTASRLRDRHVAGREGRGPREASR